VKAYACVIGNPSHGGDSREGISSDVDKVVKYLSARGAIITNHRNAVGLDKADMLRTVESFVHQIGNQPAIAIFYYCGHAVESRDPKHIYLLGQDVRRADSAKTEKSISLLTCLEKLRAVNGLKIVILDACRLADDEQEDGFWEAFEDVHRDFLRSIPDLYIVTSTGSGKRAYQGCFTNTFIGLLEKLNQNAEDLLLPLEGWLRNAFGKIAEEHGSIQRPKLYCDVITGEWAIGELIGGGKMTEKEQLDEAQEALNRRRQEVWDAPNGIQFIMHAIHHKRWEALQKTDFKVVNSEGAKQVDLISVETSDVIRNYLIGECSKFFEEAKKCDEPKEDNGYFICNEMPVHYGPMIYWRWRVEPREYFVFLAGGVGPRKKQDDWANHSPMQLKEDTPSGLIEALDAYADAFRTCYK
jgi:hypothetical protein